MKKNKYNPWEDAHMREKIRRAQEREENRRKSLIVKVAEMGREKPYSESNRYTRIFAEWMSYLFNIISAFGGAYAAYWIFHFVTGFAIIGIVAGILFLAGLEYAKRQASTKLYMAWHFRNRIDRGWLLLNSFLVVVSVSSTLFGVYKGTFDFAPEAKIITQDSIAAALSQQLAQNNEIIDDLRDTRWKGTITRTANKGINELLETNETLMAAIIGRVEKVDGQNEEITSVHMADVRQAAYLVVGVMGLLEFLFELCIWYVMYYWRRCWEEEKDEIKDIVEDGTERKKWTETDGTEKTERTEKAPPPHEASPMPVRVEDPVIPGRLLKLLESQSERIDVLASDVETIKTQTEYRPTDAKASEVPSVVPSEKTERKPTQKRRRKRTERKDGKRKCLQCGTDISHRTKRAKYCSDACRKDYHEGK